RSFAPPSNPAPAAPISPEHGQSIVMPVEATKKSGHLIKRLIAFFVIVILVGAAGAGAWYFYQQSKGSYNSLLQGTKDSQDMIPGSASAIVEYQIATEADRQKIKDFWAQQTTS